VNPHDPQTLIAGAILLLAIIAAVFLIARERKRAQSQRLRQRFGAEYSRVVDRVGDRDKAEAELKAREARVERFKLVALPPAEAARFAREWELLQARFVDQPSGVVGEADRLVRELMLKRGYPMGDFEHRAADISVHHPEVVGNYRVAQAIAARELRGEATTEDLRKAVVHYRALFEDLLEFNQPGNARHVVGVTSARTKEVT
jgi:hypothetical protein